MCRADLDKLKNLLMRNLGKEKLLSEWHKEFNEIVNKRDTVSLKQFRFALKVIDRKGWFRMEEPRTRSFLFLEV